MLGSKRGEKEALLKLMLSRLLDNKKIQIKQFEHLAGRSWKRANDLLARLRGDIVQGISGLAASPPRDLYGLKAELLESGVNTS